MFQHPILQIHPVLSTTSDAISLSWTPPAQGGGATAIDGNYVEWFSANDGGSVYTAHIDVTITALTPNALYDFTVAAISSDGRQGDKSDSASEATSKYYKSLTFLR